LRIFRASFAQPFTDWLDFLARRADGAEPSRFSQRKSFVAARLMVGLSVLAFSPIWLFFYGVPSVRQMALFTLTLTPLVAVAALKRTGDMRLAQRISICGWAAMAIGVAAMAHGYEVLSVALLSIALIEAILTLEMSTLSGVTGGVLLLIALDVFLEPSMPQAAATRAEIALRLTPLLIYISALAAGPILAERARARKEERIARDLRLLTEALGDILVHFDRSGSVMQIVGDTQRIYGLNSLDLRGRGFFHRVHVADRPAFLKLVSDAAANIAPEHALLRINVGAIENVDAGYTAPVYHYFEARSRPVEATGSGGSCEPQVICILRDVTAARKAEETIAEAQRESQLAIAAKARFLATVSHELRTPLNAIIGFSEMLEDEQLEPQDPRQRREYSRIIAESGRHLHEVVNSILDMSKIESGAMQIFPEPFCSAALIAQCCDMMQLKADQAQITLCRSLPRDDDEIVADPRACRQIALNLLSNAIKFTPPRGKIVLKAYIEGNSFVLSVADTGVGIAPSDLARLGDPFFQASSSHDRNFEGTGLGLSVVRGLVGLHGGAILVESAVNAGTTVTVRLPRDGHLQPERASYATKIETIARHGVSAPGVDLVHEKEAVKKIA
jgi:two-component system, cell cycle sensor histidine kinase DivJ